MNSGQAKNDYNTATHEPFDWGAQKRHDAVNLAANVGMKAALDWRDAKAASLSADDTPGTHEEEYLAAYNAEYEAENALMEAADAYEQALRACLSGGAGEGGE